MARLTTKQRKAMPKGQFALPKQKRFPINDKTHEEKAIQLAPRALKAGTITPMQKAMIDKKAKAKLNKGK